MNETDQPPSPESTSPELSPAPVTAAGQDPVTQDQTQGRVAVRLLQGYLWHPAKADLDLEQYLPRELDEAYILWDPVSPPFAFFENGEPTASQTFYQFTVLQVYEERPSGEALHRDAQHVSEALNPMLDATPDGVGWQLWEDLREL